MRLVDIMIVGAGRSGTSSLLRQLGQHPGLRAQTTPEITWFSDPQDVEADPDILSQAYWSVQADDPVLRVGKAAGLMYEPAGLARLRATSPGAQLAVILREPVERTRSAYWYGRAKGLEPLDSFEDAVWADPARFDGSPTGRELAYLDWSHYARYLSGLFDAFGRERVHVIFLDEFVADPRRAVDGLMQAVSLDAALLPDTPRKDNAAIRARRPELAKARRRQSGVRRLVPARARRAVRLAYRRTNEVPTTLPPLDPRVERDLQTHFQEHNDQLEQLLGRPLPGSWSTTGTSVT
jgi:hypothetical protein